MQKFGREVHPSDRVQHARGLLVGAAGTLVVLCAYLVQSDSKFLSSRVFNDEERADPFIGSVERFEISWPVIRPLLLVLAGALVAVLGVLRVVRPTARGSFAGGWIVASMGFFVTSSAVFDYRSWHNEYFTDASPSTQRLLALGVAGLVVAVSGVLLGRRESVVRAKSGEAAVALLAAAVGLCSTFSIMVSAFQWEYLGNTVVLASLLGPSVGLPWSLERIVHRGCVRRQRWLAWLTGVMAIGSQVALFAALGMG